MFNVRWRHFQHRYSLPVISIVVALVLVESRLVLLDSVDLKVPTRPSDRSRTDEFLRYCPLIFTRKSAINWWIECVQHLVDNINVISTEIIRQIRSLDDRTDKSYFTTRRVHHDRSIADFVSQSKAL